MTAALSRADLLIGQLLDFARSEPPMACFCVRAVHSHCIKAFTAPGAMIALPLRGTKRVLQNGQWLEIGSGGAMLATGQCTRDVENVPDAAGGEYLAISIPIHEAVLASARQIVGTHLPPQTPGIVALPQELVVEPLLAWSTALREGRQPMACHAMLGLVLELHERGHHALLQAPPPSLARQIRELVGNDPAHDWNSAEIENAFSMSGASVRRYLAGEGTNLRTLITEARLARALELLYTTRLPIKSVAQRVGYASPGSFVKRFAERYGMEPARIGNG